MRNHSTLFLVLVCLLFCTSLGAKHIIGGDMYYECILSDTIKKQVNFRVTMKMYRDCSNPEGALFDRDAKIGIYEKLLDGRFRYVDEILNLSYQNPIKKIDPAANNPCLLVPVGVCVEEATYVFTTGILPMLSSGSYYIAYQRCCRNETISNIFNPGMAGAAFTIEITAEAQKKCNNSPRFKSFPPVVICVNNPINYDHSVTDTEGDLVTYEFCAPLTAGGQDGSLGGKNTCFGVTPDPSSCLPPYAAVLFKNPFYSTQFPMGGSPQITIDPLTGLITGTPNIQGQFVVGVCIKEFRNGILLTETRRDFQFNVSYCEPKVYAKVESDSAINGKTFYVNSCGDFDVDFTNLSTDEQFISKYKWIFSIQGTDQIVNSRDARFSFPALGSYTGKMVLNEGTSCADSLDLVVRIFPPIQAAFDYAYDTCVAGPVLFRDSSKTGSNQMVGWSWNFAGQGTSIIPNPGFQFPTPGKKTVQLEVTDINGCKSKVQRIVPYYPVPPLLIVDPSQTSGCSPLDVCLRNLSSPIDTSYNIHWDFGDGTTGSQISPCHRYEQGGVYNVKLEVTSPLGCYTERYYNQLIRVEQSPIADFEATPDKLSSFDPVVTLNDLSTFSNSRQWTFNDKDKSVLGFLQYTFRDTGIQKIQLVAISLNGCSDTLVKYIDVEPRVTYFLPNAFTPNGDSKNDVFTGVGYTFGMEQFELSVWDRWGSMIFQTNNPLEGWNGRFENSGENAPNGVYVFRLSYRTPRKELVENKGFVTLIR